MNSKSDKKNKVLDPLDFILFGATGDLAIRKLLPALYYQHYDDNLPDEGRIVGVARSSLSREDYQSKVRDSIKKHVDQQYFSSETLESFLARVHYAAVDVANVDGYQDLIDILDTHDHQRFYYLSTGPDLFAPICLNLETNNLIQDNSRLAVEKPLGRDLESAREISRIIGSVFREEQIYRIDHYLGKEPVQNLLALRFGNALFEPLWRRGHIKDVQITVSETLGVEGRGEFYDSTGALRDMVQNHLLQLLSIIAMEVPSHHNPDAIRDEKLKVLRSLRPLENEEVDKNTVRGQYRSGAIGKNVVSAYHDEPGIASDSRTESFVAIRANIDNWRWAGVPFYLRTGKRMQNRFSEIIINFERLPHAIFQISGGSSPSNHLVIRLQPEEKIQLSIRSKQPGTGMKLRPVDLNLDLAESLAGRQADAYERLILDMFRGSQILFVRNDELEEAWSWIDPILNHWQESEEPPVAYTAGTNGPVESAHLLFENGSRWHDDR